MKEGLDTLINSFCLSVLRVTLTRIAIRSHEARLAITKPIVLSALRPVLTLARLAAVRPVKALRARLIACRPNETGHTLTLSRHMIALGTVLAATVQRTVQPVFARRTRMLARRPNVAGPTHVLAGHVVARRIVVRGRDGALLLAAQAEGARGARPRTIVARPAATAQTVAGQRIARGVVEAAALALAAGAVQAVRALGAAVDACDGRGMEKGDGSNG